MKFKLIKFFLSNLIVFTCLVCMTNYCQSSSASLKEAGFNVPYAAKDTSMGTDMTVNSLSNKISNYITITLSFVGIIFIVLAIYAGYLWMIARGNEEQVTKSKNILTAAVIGIIIVLMAYVISFFVISKLTARTLG